MGQESIYRHSGIWGAADQAVLNNKLKKSKTNPPEKNWKLGEHRRVGTCHTSIGKLITASFFLGGGGLTEYPIHTLALTNPPTNSTPLKKETFFS
jgi:hypothetical protein